MHSIVYFDYVALPIYAILLYASYARGMTRGWANRMFVALLWVSLASTVCDLGMEMLTAARPVPQGRLVAATILTYGYFTFHNAMAVLYFLFVYAITRTWYMLRREVTRVLVAAPYAVLLVILFSNLFNGKCFTVTAEAGYERGEWRLVFYAISTLYVVFGLAHLMHCKRFLPFQKWLSLMAMYVLTYAAVIYQFAHGEYLVEMAATAIALLFIELLVLRPEEVLDTSVGLQSFHAYEEELKKLMITRQRVQIVVIRFINAGEVRTYLGEPRYIRYIKLIADHITRLCWRERLHKELYFEAPGTFYIILDEHDFDAEHAVPKLMEEVSELTKSLKETGAKLSPRICQIHFPEDLDSREEILHFGHHFDRLVPQEQIFTKAAGLVESREFQIVNHMNEILGRAIEGKRFEIHYQPIYSIWDRKFISAEALIRLTDEEFGAISPSSFIPEAERRGLILPIGDYVLDAVHRFASENELEKLGLSYIEVNLSVAQCLEPELPEKLAALREKYGVHPDAVNLEITETSCDNIGEVMDDNLRLLSEQGYSFSLDDYGVGYSNIRRVTQLPLKIIKIDKSLVDNMGTSSGKSIMSNTVRMMKDIHKELVIEGVETKEDLDELRKMGCDFIQGYYFSKPLPAAEFVEFLREKNFAG